MKPFIVLIALLLLAACTQSQTVITQNTTIVQDDHEDFEGRAVFTITDAAADMGTVTSVRVTLDSLEVYSADEGWVTVEGDEETYDLLRLKAEGSHALLADESLETGSYSQVRFDISSVTVVDENGTHDATVPAEKMTIPITLVVEANGTSTASFDFLADESLHTTTEGDYVMAPVVEAETRTDAVVAVDEEERVRIIGGSVTSSTIVGMDLDGRVGIGVRIPANAALMMDDGSVVIGGTLNATGGIIIQT